MHSSPSFRWIFILHEQQTENAKFSPIFARFTIGHIIYCKANIARAQREEEEETAKYEISKQLLLAWSWFSDGPICAEAGGSAQNTRSRTLPHSKRSRLTISATDSRADLRLESSVGEQQEDEKRKKKKKLNGEHVWIRFMIYLFERLVRVANSHLHVLAGAVFVIGSEPRLYSSARCTDTELQNAILFHFFSSRSVWMGEKKKTFVMNTLLTPLSGAKQKKKKKAAANLHNEIG